MPREAQRHPPGRGPLAVVARGRRPVQQQAAVVQPRAVDEGRRAAHRVHRLPGLVGVVLLRGVQAALALAAEGAQRRARGARHHDGHHEPQRQPPALAALAAVGVEQQHGLDEEGERERGRRVAARHDPRPVAREHVHAAREREEEVHRGEGHVADVLERAVRVRREQRAHHAHQGDEQLEQALHRVAVPAVAPAAAAGAAAAEAHPRLGAVAVEVGPGPAEAAVAGVAPAPAQPKQEHDGARKGVPQEQEGHDAAVSVRYHGDALSTAYSRASEHCNKLSFSRVRTGRTTLQVRPDGLADGLDPRHGSDVAAATTNCCQRLGCRWARWRPATATRGLRWGGADGRGGPRGRIEAQLAAAPAARRPAARHGTIAHTTSSRWLVAFLLILSLLGRAPPVLRRAGSGWLAGLRADLAQPCRSRANEGGGMLTVTITTKP